MSTNQPLAQLNALRMEMRVKRLIITAFVSLAVLPPKAAENPTASELSDEKRPSAWDLLGKQRRERNGGLELFRDWVWLDLSPIGFFS